MTRVITKEEFEALSPRERGYTVYMCGERDDQPNVPNEHNPYRMDTPEHRAWNDGQLKAVLEVQDMDD